MTSQHGNKNNMGDDVDAIYQGEFFKLSESRKRFIGSKADTWKPKYLVFRHKGEKPVLEYHKKKPKAGKKAERTLTDTFELWPSYKVEKLKNAKGRAFVCEVTSADFHIFLSADEEKEIDVLTFVLQIQIRLKENIRTDVILVMPVDSECQQKIGAQGSACVLHASPWGLTLALNQTRALLAQWPLKSIKYYETSGTGNFNIEAGRVAPMGDGLFKFITQSGDDDFMYDLVDSYIVNTLDRVKPTQRGTREEIEDYIREHDHLHSLTTVSVCPLTTPEIQRTLKKNWSVTLPGSETLQSSPNTTDQSRSPHSSRGRKSQTPTSSTAAIDHPTTVMSQSSSLVINLERPGESSDGQRSNVDVMSNHWASSTEDSHIADQPQVVLSRSGTTGVPRRSRRREHSIPRKVDVTSSFAEGEFQPVSTESSLASPVASTRRHSNPANAQPSMNSDRSGAAVSLNIDVAQQHSNAHHHTEFYKLSSPNMKIRVSKSPVVSRNPNKVGRAEYLLSLQQSGVKSPVMSPVEEHQDALDYCDAVARASQQKYAGHNSTDRNWGKLQRELSHSDQSTSGVSSSSSPRVSSNLNHLGGYVNIPSSPAPNREIRHSRQQSAPDSLSSASTLQYSRQNSKDSVITDPTLSPPMIHHHRQRSADEVSHTSGVSDPYSVPEPHYRSGDHHVTSQVSAISACSQHSQNSSFNTQQVERQFSGVSGIDGPVGDWLISASCEDLSDHMRTVIYDDDSNDQSHIDSSAYNEMDDSKVEGTHVILASTELSVPSSDKPPLPFTGLKKFHDHTDIGGHSRDRSKSFGYMNIPNSGAAALPKPQSSAPSAHLIRKMVNARAKQETLRKSLSNPNFLNLGSKEHLCTLKNSNPTANGSTGKLAVVHKQKSKSFGSLFPAIKKALSRESIGHSRSTTPERRSSRSTTPERRSSFSFRRRSSDADSNLKRQSSFHSYGEMTIKGIRMTERSRSFRRVRGAKSVEILSSSNDDSDPNRLSSATTLSSPEADQLVASGTSADESNRASFTSAVYSTMTINPNYVAATHIALTTPSSLPPNLSAPSQPPPLPAPRKISTVGSPEPQTHQSTNTGNVLYHSPSGNSAYQNITADSESVPDLVKEEEKSMCANVSSLFTRHEENDKHEEACLQNQQRKSQHRQSATKPHGDDPVKNQKPPTPRRGSSQKSQSENQRSSSTSQHRQSVSKPNGDDTVQKEKPPTSSHVRANSQKNQPENQRYSSSTFQRLSNTIGTAAPVQGEDSGSHRSRWGSHSRASRTSRSSTSSQGSNPTQKQPSLDRPGDRAENSAISSAPEEPTTKSAKVARASVKPFQPTPYKRLQNGFRSVHAPTGPAKP